MVMVEMDREMNSRDILKEGRMGLGGIGCRGWERKTSQQ